MRLSQILFGRLTQGLRDFEWAVGITSSPGLDQAAFDRKRLKAEKLIKSATCRFFIPWRRHEPPPFLHVAQASASLFWHYLTFRVLFRSGFGGEEGNGDKAREPAGIVPLLFWG